MLYSFLFVCVCVLLVCVVTRDYIQSRRSLFYNLRI